MGTSSCHVCGESHVEGADRCPVLQRTLPEGTHPRGVPLRVYGGYLEARAALKADAPAAAVRVLQWLLGHLAEERGVAPALSFAAKLDWLCAHEVISPRLAGLLPRALATDASSEQAWALMSIAEHALYRLYLAPRPR